MAEVRFRFVANDKGLRDGIKRSKKQLSGFETATKKISSGIGKALGGIGLAMGVGAIVSELKQATQAAVEDARAQRLLEQQLRNTVGATKEQIAGAEDYITKLSLQTGILDDDLRPALSNAVRGTGDLEEAQKLLEIALDGAAATGKSVDTVMSALIKANNGNTTSLYRLAPQLKKTKGGVDDFAESVAGAAETAADPFARLNVATSELQEQIGTMLLPYIEKFANYLIETVVPAVKDFLDEINDPNTESGKLFQRLKDLAEGFWDVIVKISSSKEFQKMLEAALGVAEDLLLVLQDINNLDNVVDRTVNQTLASMITSNPFATPQTIVDLMAKDGVKFSLADAKKAFNDPIGGADGDKYTPWPMAKGGVVMPRPGGTIARIGEAGRPEAVIPLDRFGGLGGNTYVININKANVSGNEIVTAIQRWERSTGKRVLNG
jgi:hypothetical protein